MPQRVNNGTCNTHIYGQNIHAQGDPLRKHKHFVHQHICEQWNPDGQETKLSSDTFMCRRCSARTTNASRSAHTQRTCTLHADKHTHTLHICRAQTWSYPHPHTLIDRHSYVQWEPLHKHTHTHTHTCQHTYYVQGDPLHDHKIHADRLPYVACACTFVIIPLELDPERQCCPNALHMMSLNLQLSWTGGLRSTRVATSSPWQWSPWQCTGGGSPWHYETLRMCPCYASKLDSLVRTSRMHCDKTNCQHGCLHCLPTNFGDE